jgi:hypothetical protein
MCCCGCGCCLAAGRSRHECWLWLQPEHAGPRGVRCRHHVRGWHLRRSRGSARWDGLLAVCQLASMWRALCNLLRRAAVASSAWSNSKADTAQALQQALSVAVGLEVISVHGLTHFLCCPLPPWLSAAARSGQPDCSCTPPGAAQHAAPAMRAGATNVSTAAAPPAPPQPPHHAALPVVCMFDFLCYVAGLVRC